MPSFGAGFASTYNPSAASDNQRKLQDDYYKLESRIEGRRAEFKRAYDNWLELNPNATQQDWLRFRNEVSGGDPYFDANYTYKETQRRLEEMKRQRAWAEEDRNFQTMSKRNANRDKIFEDFKESALTFKDAEEMRSSFFKQFGDNPQTREILERLEKEFPVWRGNRFKEVAGGLEDQAYEEWKRNGKLDPSNYTQLGTSFDKFNRDISEKFSNKRRAEIAAEIEETQKAWKASVDAGTSRDFQLPTDTSIEARTVLEPWLDSVRTRSINAEDRSNKVQLTRAVKEDVGINGLIRDRAPAGEINKAIAAIARQFFPDQDISYELVAGLHRDLLDDIRRNMKVEHKTDQQNLRELNKEHVLAEQKIYAKNLGNSFSAKALEARGIPADAAVTIAAVMAQTSSTHQFSQAQQDRLLNALTSGEIDPTNDPERMRAEIHKAAGDATPWSSRLSAGNFDYKIEGDGEYLRTLWETKNTIIDSTRKRVEAILKKGYGTVSERQAAVNATLAHGKTLVAKTIEGAKWRLANPEKWVAPGTVYDRNSEEDIFASMEEMEAEYTELLREFSATDTSKSLSDIGRKSNNKDVRELVTTLSDAAVRSPDLEEAVLRVIRHFDNPVTGIQPAEETKTPALLSGIERMFSSSPETKPQTVSQVLSTLTAGLDLSQGDVELLAKLIRERGDGGFQNILRDYRKDGTTAQK